MSKNILFSFFVIFFFSCQKEDSSQIINQNPEENCTIAISEKINGGSILQFNSVHEVYQPNIYMHKKTGANWLAMSEIIRLKTDDFVNMNRPYEFRIPEYLELLNRVIPVVLNNNGIDYILLKPLTDFSYSTVEFWGDFYVETEEEWLEIENTYFELFDEVAKLSLEYPQIKMLSIGNELREFTKRRPQFFKGLILHLRENYPNIQLTYAANWDEYEGITFWEDLDFIGVNSYFPLVNKETPTVEEIKDAFQPIKNNLEDFSCFYNKPILFSEYGFRSIDFAAWKAWELEPFSVSNVNHEAQNNGYEGFYQTFWGEPWVAGGFFWEWEISFTEHVGGHNNGWQVSGKPAQEIIKKYYTKNVD
ncbi:glycoside hydrolase family 113 [Aureivirga sp. CE67]|uniref:glycoside hydrolase family 113 n=1 Tax=Aureivirga sp. CE67 TaxID=1788983 RepID=UPI0018CAD4E3|nr:hypothetical protein [Aureivirga sp. CE67]